MSFLALRGVEVGRDQYQAIASVVDEPERSRLYDEMIKLMPAFADYRDKTSRTIPVVALTRAK